jgi:hypothetical protein
MCEHHLLFSLLGEKPPAIGGYLIGGDPWREGARAIFYPMVAP